MRSGASPQHFNHLIVMSYKFMLGHNYFLEIWDSSTSSGKFHLQPHKMQFILRTEKKPINYLVIQTYRKRSYSKIWGKQDSSYLGIMGSHVACLIAYRDKHNHYPLPPSWTRPYRNEYPNQSSYRAAYAQLYPHPTRQPADPVVPSFKHIQTSSFLARPPQSMWRNAVALIDLGGWAEHKVAWDGH